MRELAGGKLRLDTPAPSVARLTLASEAKRNALDHEILDALASVLSGGELDARCLVITATGTTFSAGYDIGALAGETLARDAEAIVARPFAAAIEALDAYVKRDSSRECCRPRRAGGGRRRWRGVV